MSYLAPIIIRVKCLNNQKTHYLYGLDDTDCLFGIYSFVEREMYRIYGKSAIYLTFAISIDYDYKLFKNLPL